MRRVTGGCVQVPLILQAEFVVWPGKDLNEGFDAFVPLIDSGYLHRGLGQAAISVRPT
jgi:hypothetical protein